MDRGDAPDDADDERTERLHPTMAPARRHARGQREVLSSVRKRAAQLEPVPLGTPQSKKRGIQSQGRRWNDRGRSRLRLDHRGEHRGNAGRRGGGQRKRRRRRGRGEDLPCLHQSAVAGGLGPRAEEASGEPLCRLGEQDRQDRLQSCPTKAQDE